MASNNPFAQQTITLINSSEVNLVLLRAQTLMAVMSTRGAYNRLYNMKDQEFCKRALLYIYNYFLSSWDYGINAYNYCTAAQMVSVLSELEQLLVDVGACAGTITNFTSTTSVQFNPISATQSNKIPYSFMFIVGAGQTGIKYTNPALVGVQDLTSIVIQQSTYQLKSGFTFDPVTGTIDLTLSGYILQVNDVITGTGSKLF